MNNADVAPHGIIGLALFALLLVLLIHFLGFRIVAAVKVG